MSEVLDEYAGQREVEPAANIAQEVERMGHLLHELDAGVQAAEEALMAAKARRNRVRFQDFPELMKRAGNLAEWNVMLPTGKRMHIERSVDISAKLSEGKKEFALRAIIDSGSAHLLSNDITLSYTAGQQEELKAAQEKLKQAGLSFEAQEAIHSSRYTSWCIRQVEENKIKEDQFSLFGIHRKEQVTVEIKDPPRKRRKTSE